MMPETMPRERPEPLWIENCLELPRCCPVSRNPQPGSVIRLRYRAAGRVLEAYSLARYIQSFRGGAPDGTRNMEAMIQKIAAECAAVLGVPVTARADLVLVPHQQMRVICRARP